MASSKTHEGIEMSHVESESKITMACPSGHRVRGGADMVGRTVRCPKCQAEFVFAEKPVPAVETPESRQVTDTGVMRILGDPEITPMGVPGDQVSLRPCSRCGVAIAETLTVCNHCNCYVGVMPSFMKRMSGNAPQQS